MTSPTPDPIKTIASDIHHTALALELPESVYNDYTKWLTQAINNELLRARQELFDLYGTPVCDNLHHIKKHQHRASEECPVVKRLTQLKQSQTEGGE